MFEKIKGNFGFGVMRLPLTDGEFDKERFCRMADEYINAGFNYFDTAHGYMEGKSEIAVRECVLSGFARSEQINILLILEDNSICNDIIAGNVYCFFL